MFRFVVTSVALLLIAELLGAQDREPKPPLPPVIDSTMVLPGTKIKASSAPNDLRIYQEDDGGKVNRLKQPKGLYPKFPKQDVKLEPREQPQFHQGRDFPTPTPTAFKAGVHGTVIFADEKKGMVLVAVPGGNVIHYLHASEVNVKPGFPISPDTVLGKTSDHLHIQASDKEQRLIDVDRAFVAAREKPRDSTPIVYAKPDWVEVGPRYVSDKKPVVIDGVLKVEESKRIYFDDNAAKRPAVAKDAKPDAITGKWRSESTGFNEYRFAEGTFEGTHGTIGRSKGVYDVNGNEIVLKKSFWTTDGTYKSESVVTCTIEGEKLICTENGVSKEFRKVE